MRRTRNHWQYHIRRIIARLRRRVDKGVSLFVNSAIIFSFDEKDRDSYVIIIVLTPIDKRTLRSRLNSKQKIGQAVLATRPLRLDFTRFAIGALIVIGDLSSDEQMGTRNRDPIRTRCRDEVVSPSFDKRW